MATTQLRAVNPYVGRPYGSFVKVGNFAVTLEPVAPNTGSGPRLNATFAFSAWKDGVIGSMAGKVLHEGVGITNGTTGACTLSGFPQSGTWRIERVFLDGGDCVENATAS